MHLRGRGGGEVEALAVDEDLVAILEHGRGERRVAVQQNARGAGGQHQRRARDTVLDERHDVCGAGADGCVEDQRAVGAPPQRDSPVGDRRRRPRSRVRIR